MRRTSIASITQPGLREIHAIPRRIRKSCGSGACACHPDSRKAASSSAANTEGDECRRGGKGARPIMELEKGSGACRSARRRRLVLLMTARDRKRQQQGQIA